MVAAAEKAALSIELNHIRTAFPHNVNVKMHNMYMKWLRVLTELSDWGRNSVKFSKCVKFLHVFKDFCDC